MTPPTRPRRPLPGAGPAARDDLAARVFRALYAGFDLHAVPGACYLAVPAGTPCYPGSSLSEVARQISTAPPGPAPSRQSQPRHARKDPIL